MRELETQRERERQRETERETEERQRDRLKQIKEEKIMKKISKEHAFNKKLCDRKKKKQREKD